MREEKIINQAFEYINEIYNSNILTNKQKELVLTPLNNILNGDFIPVYSIMDYITGEKIECIYKERIQEQLNGRLEEYNKQDIQIIITFNGKEYTIKKK